MNPITIVNKTPAATTLLVDGVNLSIVGSGSIEIDEGQLIRLLADSTSRLRFLPAGDLSHSDPAPSPPAGTEPPSFSATVDLAASGTTPIVPAVAGRSWVTTLWRAFFTGGAGATVTIKEAGEVVEGVAITGATSPFVATARHMATAAGAGLDVVTVGGATGTATLEIWGSYV
jgi:hypothetical protein